MENADLNWRKTTYSNGGENCVEVGDGARSVLIRDTTERNLGNDRTVLNVTTESVDLIHGVAALEWLYRDAPAPLLSPRTPPRRRSRLADGVAWALAFEDRQCGPRAGHRVASDLSEFSQAELDRRGVIRHDVILVHKGQTFNEGRFSPMA